MYISDIRVFTSERKLKIYFDNGQEISYVKFGKDLFCGGMHTERVDKSDPVLQDLKAKAILLGYFQNNNINVRLTDITAAKELMKQFINKEVTELLVNSQ